MIRIIIYVPPLLMILYIDFIFMRLVDLYWVLLSHETTVDINTCTQFLDICRTDWMSADYTESPKDVAAGHDFSTLINRGNISQVLKYQDDLLARLEKTNAMLQTVNELSTHRLSSMASQLRSNVRLLLSIKRDLNSVLKRTASIRKTLAKQYPTEYTAAAQRIETAWRAELDDESGQPSLQSEVLPRIMEDLPE